MLILPARVKACLANQRFQENDALRPDWRLVLVRQAIPRLSKITLEGPIMSLLILSSRLSITQMETFLVKAANGGERLWRRVQVSWSIIQRRCWYRCATLATKYFGSYVKGVEDIMFWRNPVRGVKVSRTRKEANSGIPNYLQAACCKSCNQRCWRRFILICTVSEDVALIQDGWRKV